MIFKKKLLIFFSFVAFVGKRGKKKLTKTDDFWKLFAYYTFLIKIYNLSLSSDIKVQLHTFMTDITVNMIESVKYKTYILQQHFPHYRIRQ
jgi:hypothetical protein